MKTLFYKRLWRFYPAYLEIIPLTVIIASLLYTWISYPQLPDSIAVGITANGTVTAYTPKDFGSVFYTPLSALVLYALLTFVSYRRMAKLEDPSGELHLPAHLAKKVSSKYLESYRTFSVRMIFIAITALVIATNLSSFLQIQASFDNLYALLGYLPWVFYLLAMICALLQFIKTRNVRKTIQGL